MKSEFSGNSVCCCITHGAINSHFIFQVPNSFLFSGAQYFPNGKIKCVILREKVGGKNAKRATAFF
jgi:hypothetical protein